MGFGSWHDSCIIGRNDAGMIRRTDLSRHPNPVRRTLMPGVGPVSVRSDLCSRCRFRHLEPVSPSSSESESGVIYRIQRFTGPVPALPAEFGGLAHFDAIRTQVRIQAPHICWSSLTCRPLSATCRSLAVSIAFDGIAVALRSVSSLRYGLGALTRSACVSLS